MFIYKVLYLIFNGIIFMSPPQKGPYGHKVLSAHEVSRIKRIYENPTPISKDVSTPKPPVKTKGRTTTLVGTNAGTSAFDVFGRGPAVTKTELSLLKEVSDKCEVIEAVLHRIVQDIMSTDFYFKKRGEGANEEQYKTLMNNDPDKGDLGIFVKANDDDSGWLSEFVYDYALYRNAYIEVCGNQDFTITNDGKPVHFYGGEFKTLFNVDAASIEPLAAQGGRGLADPPSPAYIFDGDTCVGKNKILRLATIRKGRLMGTPPIISLMNVIAWQISLTNYIGKLYAGKIPKTLLNAGDMDPDELTELNEKIQAELEKASNPYGIMFVNVPEEFHFHRLMDTPKEGMFLETLLYYREEICSVYGIPPVKMGWSSPGGMGASSQAETQLITWYDAIDSYHRDIQNFINNTLFPVIGITDWEFNFKPIKPKNWEEKSKTMKELALAVSRMRQENLISINEGRAMINFAEIEILDTIKDDFADDIEYPSPKFDAKPETQINAIFPGKEEKDIDDNGDGRSLVELEKGYALAEKLTDEQINFINGMVKIQDNEEINEYNFLITIFAIPLGKQIVKEFATALKTTKTKAITPAQYENALNKLSGIFKYRYNQIDSDIKSNHRNAAKVSLSFVGESLGNPDLSFNRTDENALNSLTTKWTTPALSVNTLATYESEITKIFRASGAAGENWEKVMKRIKDFVEPQGKKFPKYVYERIARSEPARFVTEGHLIGAKKLGNKTVERMVILDNVTHPDLCEPYSGSIYRLNQANDVIPAHPNCRCLFIPNAADFGGEKSV
jgi:SPP1 gp7 family putative phage head morphogenesis protein